MSFSFRFICIFLCTICFVVVEAQDNCTSMVNKVITQSRNTTWDDSTLSRLRQNPTLKKQFFRYINETYDQSLRDQVSSISLKINEQRGHQIYENFFIELERSKARLSRSGLNKMQDNPDWPQGNWAYIYPDQIGAKLGKTNATFRDLADNLHYYEDLNIDVLYILPHYQSPRLDGGYDVAHYLRTAPEMGGDDDFAYLLSQAQKRNMKVVVDFIPGHISDQHDWFRRALDGDPQYRDYFIWRNNPPEGQLVERNGDKFVRYRDETSGKEYERLLLFPDISPKHWHREGDAFYYSSFFPFQKDLNNQNPDVLREHLNTLGHWVSKGVSGIRADAIPWWIKTPGRAGVHQEETFAMSEYFHLFLKNLRPSTLYLPEVVDISANAAKYLGRSTTINGVETGSTAGAVFNFQKSVQILYAGVSGNFSDYYRYLKSYKQMFYPKNTFDILYSGNHHDEIYLGLISEANRADFRQRILNSGGILYKGDYSGGARVADMLEHDPVRINNFHKFLLGHHGSIAIYQGSELGVGNNYRHAYVTTIKMINRFKQEGRISADHRVFQEIAQIERQGIESGVLDRPLPFDSELRKMTEGRLLHRGVLSQDMIDSAAENPVYHSLSRMLDLRKKSRVFREGEREEVLDTLRDDVLAFARRIYDDHGRVEQEGLVLKNGTGQVTQVNLSKAQISQRQFSELFEVEYNQNINFVDHGDYITVELRPHEVMWLNIN